MSEVPALCSCVLICKQTQARKTHLFARVIGSLTQEFTKSTRLTFDGLRTERMCSLGHLRFCAAKVHSETLCSCRRLITWIFAPPGAQYVLCSHYRSANVLMMYVPTYNPSHYCEFQLPTRILYVVGFWLKIV